MNKSGHGVIQSEETLLLLVCSTMLLENEKVLRFGKIISVIRKVMRKVTTDVLHRLNLELFGILLTSNVIISVKSLLTETTMLIAAKTPNGFDSTIYFSK